jgi:hypothetical protein
LACTHDETVPVVESATTNRTHRLGVAVPDTLTASSSLSLITPLASTGVLIRTNDIELVGCDGVMEDVNTDNEVKVAFLS